MGNSVSIKFPKFIGSCAFKNRAHVNMFVNIVLMGSKNEEILVSLALNPLALESFISFALETFPNDCKRILAIFPQDGTIEENLRLKLLKYGADMIISDSDDVLKFLSSIVSEYLECEYFLDWRDNEIFQVTSFSKTYIPWPTTVPDLTTPRLEANEKYVTASAIFKGGDALSQGTQTSNYSSPEVQVITLDEADMSCHTELKYSYDLTECTSEDLVSSCSENDIPIPRYRRSIAYVNSYNQSHKQRFKFIEDVFDVYDHVDKFSLLSADHWLAAFVVAVETLPVAVTLATADRQRPGFPLLYANRAFEMMSGHRRESVIGGKCDFLQSRLTEAIPSERAKLEAVSRALASARPIVMPLTNCRADGNYFVNVLGLRPVFDAGGQYRYVIGIHLPSYNVDSFWDKQKRVVDILNTLPGERLHV